VNLVSILAFGFLLGVRHATDPDHVAAVATMAARARGQGKAWVLGAFWGLGHSLTVLAAGGAIVVFRIVVPPYVGGILEAFVGAVLVLLGLLNLAGYRMGSIGIPMHSHPHDPSDPEHSHEVGSNAAETAHAHAHAHEIVLPWFGGWLRETGPFQALRSAMVGLVHGLAGSAAAAVLVAGAIPEPRAAVFYLLVFGMGTMAGMLALSALLEMAMAALQRWWRSFDKVMLAATGAMSLAFGLFILYRSAFEAGIFSK